MAKCEIKFEVRFLEARAYTHRGKASLNVKIKAPGSLDELDRLVTGKTFHCQLFRSPCAVSDIDDDKGAQAVMKGCKYATEAFLDGEATCKGFTRSARDVRLKLGFSCAAVWATKLETLTRKRGILVLRAQDDVDSSIPETKR